MNNRLKVLIYGLGVVGGSLYRWILKHTEHEVYTIDPPLGLSAPDPLPALDAVFVCVPVPTLANRNQDLELVKKICMDHKDNSVFVKSSVIPGTCNYLMELTGGRVIPMPEFLTERTAEADFDLHPIVVGQTTYAENLVLDLLFPGKEIVTMAHNEAELAKYTHNGFGAMKVGYFNLIKDMCEKLRINYNSVLKGAMITGFIEETHTQVPGPDGKYGYGGKCLPKDLNAFIGLAIRMNLHGVGALMAIETSNDDFYRHKGSDFG